jgi:hypothetical protein
MVFRRIKKICTIPKLIRKRLRFKQNSKHMDIEEMTMETFEEIKILEELVREFQELDDRAATIQRNLELREQNILPAA